MEAVARSVRQRSEVLPFETHALSHKSEVGEHVRTVLLPITPEFSAKRKINH